MDKTYFGKIRTVFIDLDDTIWDFSANSKVAMRIVYEKYGAAIRRLSVCGSDERRKI